ncbi:histidine kinase, partial [candidate division GN15 bacterium]|nr:histidine kinase [candidate division GN15 bacterium]
NGPGISKDHLPLLFVERFTTKSEGHGIGLVSSGKIIQKHGGEITADTESGKGTTFTIRLPISRESDHA